MGPSNPDSRKRVVVSVASDSNFPDNRIALSPKICFAIRVVTSAGVIARREFKRPASPFRLEDAVIQNPRGDAVVSAMLRDTPIPFPLDEGFFWAARYPQMRLGPIFMGPPEDIVRLISVFACLVVDHNNKSRVPRKLLRVAVNINAQNLYNSSQSQSQDKEIAFRNSQIFSSFNLASSKLIVNPWRPVSLTRFTLFIFIVFFLYWAVVVRANLIFEC